MIPLLQSYATISYLFELLYVDNLNESGTNITLVQPIQNHFLSDIFLSNMILLYSSLNFNYHDDFLNHTVEDLDKSKMADRSRRKSGRQPILAAYMLFISVTK